MRKIFFLPAVLLLAGSCSTTQPVTESKVTSKGNVPPVREVYHGSYLLVNDLVHTRLELKPVWEKMQLIGKATITLHPHFYPTDSLTLNARGMEIRRVALVDSVKDTIPLTYTYDKLLLQIRLGKKYERNQRYTIFIDYTAKPEELKVGGSAAINEDKGLYFINADGLDTEKPKQIWTQGETESNSAWFPTIENPQQRMTQEISITVDSSYETLSNGKLIQTTCNIDGTRTDTWKQSLPCAPYLTMIAVGNYAVVHDSWRGLAVDYYVEPEYEPYARMTFGHTPEMMEFFSRKLGVDFPWEKYSQVVVREFVSGAMENTTAVVHREVLQQTPREYLDYNYEDYISHELMHHWFGDLVTCESWANVVLNEGFATYGQYLWREYKFGIDDADYLNQKDQNIYLYTAGKLDADVIRYAYSDREEMYDAISYHKGGRILHMLRKLVGDDAFFESLKEYLTRNRFTAVEIHDLRLAFEKITGQDLNWFFNEWFLSSGYPKLNINYEYLDSAHIQRIIMEQTQDFSTTPLYRIPLEVDLYVNGKAERHTIVLDSASQTFEFSVVSKPDLVNVDAEKMLLCTKKDNKSRAQYIYQYYHAPLYLDRYEAVSKIGDGTSAASEESKMMMDAMKDKFWNIRLNAVKNSSSLAKAREPGLREELESLAKNDPKSHVRVAALRLLAKNYYDTSCEALLTNALYDSSYLVIETAFNQLKDNNKKLATEKAPLLEMEQSHEIMESLAGFYVDDGSPQHNRFFLECIRSKRPVDQNYIIEQYGKYLAQQNYEMREQGIAFLDSLARNAQPWYIRLAAVRSMTDLGDRLSSRAANFSEDKIVLTASDVEKMNNQVNFLKAQLSDIKKQETNKKLLEYYQN